MTKIVRNYFLIFVIGILLIASAFGGAIADRLFVIRPLDYLFPRSGSASNSLGSRTINQTIVQEESTVIDVTENAADSVVTVSIQQERAVSPLFIDPFGFFGRQQLGQGETEIIEQDIGSGFVVEGNLVITNKHVVNEADAQYRVIDRRGEEHEVLDIYRDPANDLAILRVEDAAELNPIELGDSNSLRVGQFVIAIGTALGEFRHTVTTGVVSGLGRGIEAGSSFGGFVERLDDVIQTDAAINPGNSGGPLLNSAGQVIGINTAVSAQGENIGFAIPINILRESLTNFQETGEFDRAFLGVSYQTIPRQTALMNDVPAGALVRQVVPNSSAADAGLQEGDIITRLDGQSMAEDESSLAEVINQKRVGETLEIEYWRDGETQTVTIRLRSAS